MVENDPNAGVKRAFEAYIEYTVQEASDFTLDDPQVSEIWIYTGFHRQATTTNVFYVWRGTLLWAREYADVNRRLSEADYHTLMARVNSDFAGALGQAFAETNDTPVSIASGYDAIEGGLSTDFTYSDQIPGGLAEQPQRLLDQWVVAKGGRPVGAVGQPRPNGRNFGPFFRR